jgi:hypothetical protein
MKKHLKLATLFVAAAISVAVVSCQKDKETENLFYSPNNIPFYECIINDFEYKAYYGERYAKKIMHNIDIIYANVAYYQN